LISWSLLREEWHRAKELKHRGDVSQLKVFVNTRLSEPWQEENFEEGERLPDLLESAETYDAEVPAGVLTLLGSIDSQDDRLEYLVLGVGPVREYWLIETGVIWGNLITDAEAMYHELDERVLKRDWHAAGGQIMPLYRCVQDLKGHHTDIVRAAARQRGRILLPFSGRAESTDRLMYKLVHPSDGRGVFLSGVGAMAKDLIVELRRTGRMCRLIRSAVSAKSG
jgi:phage terminase large subunit GpA-like protein